MCIALKKKKEKDSSQFMIVQDYDRQLYFQLFLMLD